jgi:hypothetical protein
MKNSLWLFTLVLPLLWGVSCNKNNDFPRVETITKGSKWTLKIGSTPEEVYEQLQVLHKEDGFDNLALVYRQSYTRPEEIKDIFVYYNALTLQNSSGQISRIVIEFGDGKVSGIETGGGLLDLVAQWPQNYPDEETIQQGDTKNLVYEKLTAIWKVADYRDYRIILPDKPLNLPYDPDMTNYEQWAFDFIKSSDNGRYRQCAVRLYFKHKKLAKIIARYSEGQAYD